MSASYTERALAAAREQGLPEGIEDDDAVAFLADLLTGRDRTRRPGPDITDRPDRRATNRGGRRDCTPGG